MLILDGDFEIDAWSRSWKWFLIKIFVRIPFSESREEEKYLGKSRFYVWWSLSFRRCSSNSQIHFLMKQNDTYDFPFVEWSYMKFYANFGRVQISNQSLFKGNGIWEFCGRKWKGLSRYEWQDVIELSHNVKILITQWSYHSFFYKSG